MKRFSHSTLAVVLAAIAMAASGLVLAGSHHGGHHEKGDRAYLGVSLAQVQNIDDTERNGLYIAGLDEESGAAAAGLKKQDRILSVDGKKVSSHTDVGRAIAGRSVGDSVEVVVLRGNDEMTYDVVLGDRPSSISMSMSRGPHFIHEMQRSNRPVLGIHAITLNEQLSSFFNVQGGALVTEVEQDGPAWKAGLRAGDVVTGWGGSAIESMNALHARLAKSKAGDVADLEVIRRDSVERFSVTLAEGSGKGRRNVFIELKGDGEGEIMMQVEGEVPHEMHWIEKDDDGDEE